PSEPPSSKEPLQSLPPRPWRRSFQTLELSLSGLQIDVDLEVFRRERREPVEAIPFLEEDASSLRLAHVLPSTKDMNSVEHLLFRGCQVSRCDSAGSKIEESRCRSGDDVRIGLVVVPALYASVLLGDVDHVALVHRPLPDIGIHLREELHTQWVEVDDVPALGHHGLVDVQEQAEQTHGEGFSDGWGLDPDCLYLRVRF